MNQSSKALCAVIPVCLFIAAGTLFAAPGLPITRGPVTSLFSSGPDSDPAAMQGQWFRDFHGQNEEPCGYELYDNAVNNGGSPYGGGAISGSVSRISYNTASSAITNFEITATIINDCNM